MIVNEQYQPAEEKRYKLKKLKKDDFKLKVVRPRPLQMEPGNFMVGAGGQKAKKINSHFNFDIGPQIKMRLKKYTEDDQDKKFQIKQIEGNHKVFQKECVFI
jgi:hypothetical protein